jgi:hypothetical protein
MYVLSGTIVNRVGDSKMRGIDYNIYEALRNFNDLKLRSTSVLCSINTGRQVYLHNSKVYWIDLSDDVFFSLRGYDTNVTRNRINAGLKLSNCKVVKRSGKNYIQLSNGMMKEIDILKEYSLSKLLNLGINEEY